MRKRFDYDSVQPGETLGQRRIAISDEMIRTCAAAIESSHPWYLSTSPFGGRIAPPTIFDNESLRMLDECYERFGSIHAGQTWRFSNPVRLDSSATIAVVIADKYVKRDRPFLVMDLVAVDDTGATLCRSRHTSLMTLHRGDPA
ncbi:MAG: MaoC family dehydratase N-terminal domain-containing protein [Burkholderiales bacterium]|nr:MaoC family dehydratase N-terminal domain-containing protein [Burkholderiales bacterium]